MHLYFFIFTNENKAVPRTILSHILWGKTTSFSFTKTGEKRDIVFSSTHISI